VRPQLLDDNRVPVYYAGGRRIDRFRGLPEGDGGPEDWVASVSALLAAIRPPGAPADVGVSRLPDGTSLADAVTADPDRWVGPAAARLPRGETGLLVKLLDAGERLPVHWHPDRDFARAHLGSPFGKSEGWIVLEAEPGACVWLGFARDVERGEAMAWLRDGAVGDWLDAMLRLPVAAGDVLWVPAGTPHAIGPGVLIVELQEPTSFSILAEYEGFGLDPQQATLGLGWETALSALDSRAADAEPGGRLRAAGRVVDDGPAGRVVGLFGDEAGPYFAAERVACRGSLTLPGDGFRVVVVTGGSGTAGDVDVAAGATLVVPHAAGPLALSGALELIVCRGPGSG
jgi:mannose-6-phosphate isomerase